MDVKVKKKTKLLYILKFLFENTDDENGLTIQEICDYLSDNNISAERKSIYSDIDILRNFGYDIISCREGNSTFYKLVGREFELSELKLLIDSVRYSQFITPTKKEMLVNKISSLTSIHNAAELNRQVCINKQNDKWNEGIFYNVDAIYRAINKDRKICFMYFSWNQYKDKELREDGAIFTVSPFQLVVSDEKYFLLAYDGNDRVMKTYRVDRMLSIEINNERREGHNEVEKLDTVHYSSKSFGMYGGKSRTVKLRCENEFAGTIIDKFGMDTHFSIFDKNKFEIIVKIVPSNVFFGWILGTGGGVEIIEPKELKNQLVDLVRTAIKDEKFIDVS